MNKFTRHVPGFVRDLYLNDEREYVIPSEDFETLEELLNIPFVVHIKDSFDFTQFAKSQSYLMVMANDNTKWYVVGEVQDKSVLGSLPDFESVKKK